MDYSIGVVADILHRAAHDPAFRRQFVLAMGGALAEEGYILSDSEMAQMREIWASLDGLDERRAYERIMALDRARRR